MELEAMLILSANENMQQGEGKAGDVAEAPMHIMTENEASTDSYGDLW